VFNANPRSADYSQSDFNRLARYPRQQGKPAPAEAELHARQPAQRDE
jgi:hypothetical protein